MTTSPEELIQVHLLRIFCLIIAVGGASVFVNDFIERRAPAIRRWWRRIRNRT